MNDARRSKPDPIGPPADLIVFVATRPERIPEAAKPFASVDGSVPGAAVIWDHHVTGEPINLDAMPDRIERAGLRGVGTTLADSDAAVSAAVVMLGGKGALSPQQLAVLSCAAHWCDHLGPHPGFDEEANRRGERLDAWAREGFRRADDVGRAFASVCRELAECLAAGLPLPQREPRRQRDAKVAAKLDAEGKIVRAGPVALVDLRGGESVDPLATYERHDRSVAITYDEHDEGGLRYTVGVNPRVAERPEDLRPALRALAAAEHEHGPPCPSPRPGEGNWGGRQTVFGSPWNYGSRLAPERVAAIVVEALDLPVFDLPTPELPSG